MVKVASAWLVVTGHQGGKGGLSLVSGDGTSEW